MKIVLVACPGTKLDHPAPAREFSELLLREVPA